MECGYLKSFKALESWKNKRVILTIEAAAHKSVVYLNGNKLYEHNCGYTAYSVDLSNDLLFDEDNILVVYVNSNETLNQPPFNKPKSLFSKNKTTFITGP